MYVKVFRSLWDGTLGQEPQAWPVFIFLLAHADPEGVVEMTHEAISARSGMPVEVVQAAIRQLEAPDPRSRSREHEGRRLVPLDDRGWGWRLVNYLKYREAWPARASRNSEGWVYYAGEGSTVKIGFSKNPWARVSDLRVASPSIKLLGIERGDLQAERRRQEEFRGLRTRGEWFKLTGPLAAHVARLRSDGVATGRATVATKEVEVEVDADVEETEQPSLPAGDEASPVASLELNGSAPSGPRDEVGPSFPVIRPNGRWRAPEKFLVKLREAFPSPDMRAELLRASCWLEANPGRRKTRRGMPRFLVSWFARANERPVPTQPPAGFAEFWEIWPRKEGELEAQAAFAEVVAGGEYDAEDLCSLAARYVKQAREENLAPKFWLKAGTWLSMRRFTEQLTKDERRIL